MQKPLAAIAAFMAIFGAAEIASAESADITGCTNDGYKVTMHTDVEGSVGGKELKHLVAEAFSKTASAMTKDQLPKSGFPIFMENMQQAVGDQDVSPGAKIKIVGTLEFGPAGSCAP
ncbi:MAG: hypothetical protein HY370_00715 [Proteobacteria bacterium]|nr:hypothetical protein [Pseudomonadota bacterium]